MAPELRYLLDRQELTDLVGEYARGCDRRDFDAVAALFVDDGVLVTNRREPGSARPREHRGRVEIATGLRGLERYEATMHFVGQQRIAIDGDTAVGETYCLARHTYHGDDGRSRVRVLAIRYQDAFRRDGIRWRFEQRRLAVDWEEDHLLSS
jgi:ketosteroid isomerase-like protein